MIELEFELPKQFNRRLINWSKQIDRPLPWRQEQDPYRIWLSEILLQQTRAETVIDYYYRFLEAFPTIRDLSEAPIEVVLKLWEGLGYYNRARNLHKTARIIDIEYKGQFPNTYEGLLSLPGIGPYTAAAIASFAFGLSHAVVDGNVIRVISRLTGLQDPIDQPATRRLIQDLANELMGRANAAIYNQAIMDFGAMQCMPRNPDCDSCPFGSDCLAHSMNLVSTLPVKRKKQPVANRFFLFFIFYQKDTVWLMQRGSQDIWPQLFTFPFVEVTDIPEKERPQRLRKQLYSWSGLDIPIRFPRNPELKQLLSHQRIHGYFLSVHLSKKKQPPADWVPVHQGDFSVQALPRMMKTYLEDYGLPS